MTTNAFPSARALLIDGLARGIHLHRARARAYPASGIAARPSHPRDHRRCRAAHIGDRQACTARARDRGKGVGRIEKNSIQNRNRRACASSCRWNGDCRSKRFYGTPKRMTSIWSRWVLMAAAASAMSFSTVAEGVVRDAPAPVLTVRAAPTS